VNPRPIGGAPLCESKQGGNIHGDKTEPVGKKGEDINAKNPRKKRRSKPGGEAPKRASRKRGRTNNKWGTGGRPNCVTHWDGDGKHPSSEKGKVS